MAHARSLVAALLAAVAGAVAGALGAQLPAGDSLARRSHLDVAALRPGQFEYQTTLERNNSTTIVGTRTVTVSQAMYAGSPVWLLLETRSGNGVNAVDSLFADLASLRPIHWSATQGDARVAAEFRADTAFGGVSSPVGRRSMIINVPSGSLISGAMLETVLRLDPLHTAWEDSTTTLSVSLGSNAVLPTRIAVIGEDRVRVPAGTFDCWVVAVHADPARGLYWVTKSDPIVVRSALDVPTLGGAQLVSALTRISR
ncbi:MAG: hypothetical protein JWM41_2697 [Gemmatimonadetes bacterium]|nr:hypothetical protein [Gemmatimonadota bacterium]